MKKLVAFFEIPSVDFNRAVKFYETVFNTKLSVYDAEHEKMAFFPGEANSCCGAISWAKNFKPSKDGVLVSLTTDDITQTLSTIAKNGGKVVTPKTKIEADGAGYFAIFTDCEGNNLGLWCDK